MRHLSLDLIGESAFGYSFNTILGGSSKVSEAFTVLFLSFNIMFLVCKFLFPFFDYLPLAENRKIQAAKEITDNTVLEVTNLPLDYANIVKKTFAICQGFIVKFIHCLSVKKGFLLISNNSGFPGLITVCKMLCNWAKGSSSI